MGIIREALDKINDLEFENLKAEVADWTENNCTTEALLEIAKYFNKTDYIPFLQDLSDYQDSPNYQGLELEQAQQRREVMHKMFDELEKEIGKDKARELYSCL